MKRIIISAAVLSVSLSTALVKISSPAQAATWHSSTIPAKLRGHWHAKQNHRQGVHIYKHSIHYTGEKTVKVKWRYVGNRSYRFKYANSYGDTIHLRYYNHHKMTMNSFWHSYYR